MQALSVIKAFYPIHDIEPSALAITIMDPIKPLHFQRLKKTLHGRIIPSIGLAAHRHHEAILRYQLLMHMTGILTAAIRAKNQVRCRLSLPLSRLQGLADKRSINPLRHRPADYPTSGKIKYSGQIQPSLTGGHIRNVRYPRLIRMPATKAPLEHILSNRQFVVRIDCDSVRGSVDRIQTLAQQTAAYPLAANTQTLLAQRLCDSGPAVAAFALAMNHCDSSIERRVFSNPRTRWPRLPLAVAGTR